MNATSDKFLNKRALTTSGPCDFKPFRKREMDGHSIPNENPYCNYYYYHVALRCVESGTKRQIHKLLAMMLFSLFCGFQLVSFHCVVVALL